MVISCIALPFHVILPSFGVGTSGLASWPGRSVHLVIGQRPGSHVQDNCTLNFLETSDGMMQLPWTPIEHTPLILKNYTFEILKVLNELLN